MPITQTTRTFTETGAETGSAASNVVVQKTVSDDGAGSFRGVQYGAIDYGTGLITFKPTDPYTSNTWSQSSTSGSGSDGGPNGSESSSRADSWKSASSSDAWGPGSLVRVRYKIDSGVPAALQDTMPAQVIRLNLTPKNAETIVPHSVMFWFAGWVYVDRGDGRLYTNMAADGSMVDAGDIDYKSGYAEITWWNAGFDMTGTRPIFDLGSMLTAYGDWTAEKAFFRTAGSPVRPASLYVEATTEAGELISATADQNGTITGDRIAGTIQNDMGVVRIAFGEYVVAAGNEAEEWYDPADLVGAMIWKPTKVIPSTIRYNCVVLSNLPLNADILGLDPVRLPTDGRVPIYRPADVVLLHNTKSYALPNPAVAGATYDVGRTDLAALWVVDATGAEVADTHYVADLAAGTVTMAADLALGATPQPLAVRHRIEQLSLLSDVQINGQLSVAGPLARDFDADSYVSSALLFGDMFARVTNLFDQVTWSGAWSDARIGANATGEYNSVDYPIEVLNNAAVPQRWRLNFTTANAYQVIGENLGVVATGTTEADLQVLNTLTGLPYFTLRAAGWGAGWAAGNQLRFNTIGAAAPIWIARTVLPGATLNGDSIDIQLRGDVDA